MANLCAGICSSLMQVRKAQDTDGFSQRRTGLQASGRGGSFAVESVATFVWNRRQLCRGISGRFGVEYAEGDASAKNFSNSSGKPKAILRTFFERKGLTMRP